MKRVGSTTEAQSARGLTEGPFVADNGVPTAEGSVILRVHRASVVRTPRLGAKGWT